ncbi:hypothetical protein F4803DRAFT_506833 [Xylaria telfairii]|nr:hypothetical protein F4803DRAFT_506833 [Xylaria telfairii]
MILILNQVQMEDHSLLPTLKAGRYISALRKAHAKAALYNVMGIRYDPRVQLTLYFKWRMITKLDSWTCRGIHMNCGGGYLDVANRYEPPSGCQGTLWTRQQPRYATLKALGSSLGRKSITGLRDTCVPTTSESIHLHILFKEAWNYWEPGYLDTGHKAPCRTIVYFLLNSHRLMRLHIGLGHFGTGFRSYNSPLNGFPGVLSALCFDQ